MKLFKTALAGAAAALLSSQVAAAATPAARTGTPVGASEAQAEISKAAAPALAVLGIFLAVGLVMLITGDDDDDEAPVSP